MVVRVVGAVTRGGAESAETGVAIVDDEDRRARVPRHGPRASPDFRMSSIGGEGPGDCLGAPIRVMFVIRLTMSRMRSAAAAIFALRAVSAYPAARLVRWARR